MKCTQLPRPLAARGLPGFRGPSPVLVALGSPRACGTKCQLNQGVWSRGQFW